MTNGQRHNPGEFGRKAASMRGAVLRHVCIIFLAALAWSACAANYMKQGNAHYESGAFDSAVVLYQKAVQTGENPGLAHFNIGNARFQQDNIPAAIIAYRSAVGFAPDFFRGWLNLAVAYYSIDQIGECIAALRHALRIEPQHIQGRMVLASAYRKTGALRKAVVLYEQIAEKHPEQGDACIALAEIYRELEDFTLAIRWLKNYPPEGQHQNYVLQSLSEIAQTNGDLQQALYYTREAFEQKNAKWVAYRIVSLTLEMGNRHVALQEAQRGLERYPDFGDLALLGGKIAFDLELYGQAEQLFSVAADRGMAGGVVGLENVRMVLGR